MKLKILLQLFLLLLLNACQSGSSETDDPGHQPEVQIPLGFSGSMADASQSAPARSHETRGVTRVDRYRGVWTTEGLQGVGFGVYCWYTGTSDFNVAGWEAGSAHIKDCIGPSGYMLMRNQKVEWDGSKWDYSPSKYWPLVASEKLTFRAYAPYVDYNLITDPSGVSDRGTPYLPVIVHADDYCKRAQQDPLWGTSAYTDLTDAGTKSDNAKYGKHYNNFTYQMSGTSLESDSRDGTIDWYFHHGMAMFALQAQLVKEIPGTEVRITGIYTGPFYNQGLLDIFNSKSEVNTQKPIWQDRSYPEGDNFYVNIAYQHDPDGSGTNIHNDLNGVVLNASTYTNVAENGLLVIPRDYSGATKMLVRVTYTETTGLTVVTKQVEAYVNLDVQGNTVYALQLMLNSEENTLYIRSFVDVDWQVGSYDRIEL